MEETLALDLIFMVFGLGFFLFVILIITRDSREAWERRLMGAREFGFKVVNQIKEPPSKPKDK